MASNDTETTPKSDSYGADQIKVLEGLDAVRKRPAMYIGSTGVDGLHHLVYEVVDNSVDEHMAGFGETIEVTIHIDDSVTVVDNGRGIPTGIHSTQKKSAAEVALTVLHAGGKFEQGAYTVSGGLHGVGISVVNALSEWLELEIWQDGQVFEQRYERGKATAPLKMTVKEQVFKYKGGIVSFVEHLNEAKTPLHKPIYVQVEKQEMVLEVALQYNDSYAENLFSFANNINTKEGGTHLVGFKAALTRTINNYANANDLLKKASNPRSTTHSGPISKKTRRWPERSSGKRSTRLVLVKRRERRKSSSDARARLMGGRFPASWPTVRRKIRR